MYVVCKSNCMLSEAYFLTTSYVQSLLLYYVQTLDFSDVLIFKDNYNRGKLEDLQFVKLLRSKDFKKLLTSYSLLQPTKAAKTTATERLPGSH